MRQVLVPVYAGVLSALGMLFSAPGREVTQAMIQPLESCEPKVLIRAFEILVESLVSELHEGGVETDGIEVVRSLDLRYLGQSTSIAVPWADLDTCSSGFHQSHLERYGHRLDLPLELVCLRVRVLGPAGEVRLSPPGSGEVSIPDGYRLRSRIGAGELIDGPMAVVDDTGTTWIARGWHGQVDESGNLLLNFGR
jgi:N-methylhydantoinase A